MSKSTPSYSGRLGNPKVAGSNSKPHVFESWSSQTNNFKIDTCCFLAWLSAILGEGKDWFVQCRDNTTEWDANADIVVSQTQTSKFSLQSVGLWWIYFETFCAELTVQPPQISSHTDVRGRVGDGNRILHICVMCTGTVHITQVTTLYTLCPHAYNLFCRRKLITSRCIMLHTSQDIYVQHININRQRWVWLHLRCHD